MAILAVVVFAVTVVVVAAPAPGRPGSRPTSGTALGASADWGITIDAGTPAPAQIAADESLLGREVGVVDAFIAWKLSSDVQTRLLDNLRTVNRSHAVMITWEPAGTRLADIASGAKDASIDAFLRQLGSFPGAVDLRFAHEMNGSWYAWAGDPRVYVRAWDHLRDRIMTIAPRVRMVWSVNSVDRPASNTLERYWPGRDRVDIVGIDGYNCLAGWQSPSQIFSNVYARVTALDSSVPIWITETSSCEASTSVAGSRGESKAGWITELLSSPEMPRVSALIWFDKSKEFDWRTDSSAAATAALRAGLSQ